MFFLIISFKVKGNKINPANNHLKKLRENGGISYVLAALPTTKLPDQKRVVRINKIYAKLFLFITKL